MSRRALVVTWNGKDTPPELRELPAGRYVVEAIDACDFDGPDSKLRSGVLVQSWPVPPFRIYYNAA